MVQINARDWIFEVSEDPAEAVPVWAAVGGVESFDLNPSEGEESTETTVFASQGVAESQAMQRGASLQLSGKIVRTGSVQDAGQAAADALAGLVGEASLGGLRFRYSEDTDWTVWTAWVSKANLGGGNNDKTSWGATFTKSGPASVVAVA